VCRVCQAEEHVVRHLPPSRAIWGAGLARARRAA
jgi:hypothetical protein